MVREVRFARTVEKSLKRWPRHVVVKLLGWVDLVETEGLQNARKIRGYRDEALRGRRWGQRSIRLSRSWRAIYRTARDENTSSALFVEVTEVSNHDY